MLEKEFDRLVKHRLTDHVSEVPGDMWTRIHAQEKRRRALFFWRWTGGGIFLVALFLTGAVFLLHRPSPEVIAAKPATTVAAAHATLPSPTTSSSARTARTTPVASSTLVASSTPVASSNPATARPATAAAIHSTPAFAPTLAATRESRAPTARITAPTTRINAVSARITAVSTRTIAPTHLANIPAFTNAITARTPRTQPEIPTASIPKPKSKTQQPPRNWQLDIYGSPDYLFSEFRRGLSYTGGIRLTKVFHSGWNTTIGLQYSRFNLIARKDSTKYTGTRYLKTLDLPVLAGYSWGNARLRVGVNAGLIFNLHSWTEQLSQTAALYPSSQYSLSTAGLPQQYRYQFNVGTSGYLGANLSDYLGHGFSLFAEPYLRHTLFGSKVKVYPGVSGISAAGLTIGLRRQF